MTRTADLVAPLIALAQAGIPTDVQELLVQGDAMRGIAPGALEKAITAYLSALATDDVGALVEALQRTAFSDGTWRGQQDERAADFLLAEPEKAEPVAWTGNGSLSALAARGEGYIWRDKADAHPIPLYAHPAPSPGWGMVPAWTMHKPGNSCLLTRMKRVAEIWEEQGNVVTPVFIAESAPVPRKFRLGQRVTKIKGSSWTGPVVGFYSTTLTPIGYAVESEKETGSVHIYPEAALHFADISEAFDGEIDAAAEKEPRP